MGADLRHGVSIQRPTTRRKGTILGPRRPATEGHQSMPDSEPATTNPMCRLCFCVEHRVQRFATPPFQCLRVPFDDYAAERGIAAPAAMGSAGLVVAL